MEQRFNIRVGANAVIIRDNAMLLVEFGDGWHRHFNLPGGGIEPNEPIVVGLQREVREETGAAINVGPLLLALEYFPSHCQEQDGSVHKLTLIFRCALQAGSEPHLPPHPDPHQVAVRWVPLADLPTQSLLPPIADQLLSLLDSPLPYNAFHDRIYK